MSIKKRLYWLEYTDCGPLGITLPFEAVGFEVRGNDWWPDVPSFLIEYIFPKIEAWQPDVIVFFRALGYWKPSADEEPVEWIRFCELVREHPNLQHTKIMAFLEFERSAPERKQIWDARYDFWTIGPLRVIEHAKMAKLLVGEELKGFEGVNYYLLNRNGNWEIREHVSGRDGKALLADAEGEFARIPQTRLLTGGSENGYTWAVDSIQAMVPTSIVYSIKSSQDWQGGGLNMVEIERLTTIASMLGPGHQLLIGANEGLLQAGPEAVCRTLKQVQKCGNWQLFINEHMWFEIMPLQPGDFSSIVYENIPSEQLKYPFTL